ncbi:MAG: ribosome small subunit-dependent GTPase A [Gammaproteobacteria bacterium]|nr:ribosome small subunit-dependent GTPase A [Gammaproteobacteria bacterium]
MSQNPAKQAALVIAAYGKRGRLLLNDGTETGFLLKGRKLKPVCGDIVIWSQPDTGTDMILESIEERRNTLRRPDRKGNAAPLAANLDLLLVVIASQPKPDFFLTDRYIAAAHSMGCDAGILRNKTDLPGKLDTATEQELLAYGKLGYSTALTSTKLTQGIDDVAAHLAGHTGMLVGQSGVGKSSLINALLPSATVAVAELSSGTLEGRHTTTASVMHRLPENGWLIDSPGVRDFLPYFADVRAVQAGFIEIMSAAADCRFANCQHLREPGCNVKSGVEDGVISARRYESYKRLYHMTEGAQMEP